MAKEKTIQDFNTLVAETKLKYMNEKVNNNFSFNFEEKDLDNGWKFFIICNILDATKIIYNADNKTIFIKDIIMSEVRLLTKLSEGLSNDL